MDLPPHPITEEGLEAAMARQLAMLDNEHASDVNQVEVGVFHGQAGREAASLGHGPARATAACAKEAFLSEAEPAVGALKRLRRQTVDAVDDLEGLLDEITIDDADDGAKL
jgi:hypothetical protein